MLPFHATKNFFSILIRKIKGLHIYSLNVKLIQNFFTCSKVYRNSKGIRGNVMPYQLKGYMVVLILCISLPVQKI